MIFKLYSFLQSRKMNTAFLHDAAAASGLQQTFFKTLGQYICKDMGGIQNQSVGPKVC